jgi:hypothetical protein
MEYSLSRRRFLGGLLACVPLAAAPLRRFRFKESEFHIGFVGQDAAIVTTYTDGSMSAKWMGEEMQATDRNGWTHFHLRHDLPNQEVSMFEVVVKRPYENTLYVDRIVSYSGEIPGSMKYTAVEDFSCKPFGCHELENWGKFSDFSFGSRINYPTYITLEG